MRSALDLGHCWAAADTLWCTASAHARRRQDGGGDEGSEAKPQEGARSLRFAAGRVWVAGASRDTVGADVAIVAAAVHTKLGSKRDGSAEPEQAQEEVEHERQHAVHRESLVECRGYQEEQAEHGEGGAEHGVVVDGWRGTHCDGVTDNGHDEQAHEELKASQAEPEQLCHAHVDGVVGRGEWCCRVRVDAAQWEVRKDKDDGRKGGRPGAMGCAAWRDVTWRDRADGTRGVVKESGSPCTLR